MKTRFLWITDPWPTLDHPKDTTLRLIEECHRLKIESWWCDSRTIRWEEGEVWVDARRAGKVRPGREASDFDFGAFRSMRPSDFTHLFYRNDPPVNSAYLYPLQLLELGLRGRKSSRILNPPSILFGSNEKTEFFDLKALIPPAVVSSSETRLLEFLATERKVVLKPLNSAQSKGVRVLQGAHSFETNLELLREATSRGTVPVILQRYLPGIEKGEVRLWFSGGKLLAQARKLPAKGETVIDMDRGGQVMTTTLNAKEKKAALLIGKHLKKRKIVWAAVDLIDGLVTDFNFTSPGLLVQLEKLMGRNLAKRLIQDAKQAR